MSRKTAGANELEQAIRFEDKDWVYFGYGAGWEPNRCVKCYELLQKYQKPNKYCINCWKLEIFFSNCTDFEKVKEYFLEEALRDHTLHGKWLKRTMSIPRYLLTSIPENSHPDVNVKEDGVILIYNQSIEEREMRRRKILKDLRGLGLYKKDNISYRRGCLDFDRIIGNWKDWYDLNKDYPCQLEGK